MDRVVVSAVRGAASLSLFALFGLGALALAPVTFVLRNRVACQLLVRATWRLLLWAFGAFHLVRVRAESRDGVDLPSLRGCVIAANHPSLIDVVAFVATVPKTLYVAKRGLLRNFFLRSVVRATALPDDAGLADAAMPYLAAGWNVLVFPEGTRSPEEGGLRPFRRGAAQLALRAGVPLVPVRVLPTCRILGKRQPPWRVGDRCVVYTLDARAPLVAARAPGEGVHAAAIRLTDALRVALG